MYTANIKYRGDDNFLLVVTRVSGHGSDGIPMNRDKTEILLECTEQALDGNFELNDLSGGDFCRFIKLYLNNHYLLSLNLSDVIYKGYDLSVHSMKLLKASLKTALAEADKDKLDG